MNEKRPPHSPPGGAAPSPELERVLCDLRAEDDWTRANAVRTLCPCRRTDWGVPVFRYVRAMRDDPSPIVRGAVRHDLSENPRWNESWETRLMHERRSRRCKVTLARKGVALGDLCARLAKAGYLSKAGGGVPLAAGPGLADEKVTLCCRQTSLRDVMRQLSRMPGCAWEWRYRKDGASGSGPPACFELTRAPGAVEEGRAIDPPEFAAIGARPAPDRLLKRCVRYEPPDGPRVTSADVLEALHRATGLPILADYATRFYPSGSIPRGDRPLVALLKEIADLMGLHWQIADGEWLCFRSVTRHQDRRRETPNRLLARWAESRRRHGALTLEDLMEIARLPQAQLDGREMAEGARELWGLAEWPLAAGGLRQHLRYLSAFAPEQRARAIDAAGLPFTEMSPAQQKGFLSVAIGAPEAAELAPEELAGAALRVDYTVPGWYEWRVPGPSWLSWAVPLEPGPEGRRVFCPVVRERTREGALAALGRVDARLRAAVLRAARRADPRLRDAPPPDDLQIAPTGTRLAFVYLPSATNRREFVACVATARDGRSAAGCRITRART
jgi:hypothetical protein